MIRVLCNGRLNSSRMEPRVPYGARARETNLVRIPSRLM